MRGAAPSEVASATISERRSEENAARERDAASRSGDLERFTPARFRARRLPAAGPRPSAAAGAAQAIMEKTAITESQNPTSKSQPGSTARISEADQLRVWRGRGERPQAS